MKNRNDSLLVIYSWDRLWSMGPGKGSPDFSLSLEALSKKFSEITLVHPAGETDLADGLPPGVEACSFRSIGRDLSFETPRLFRNHENRLFIFIRAFLFLLNWPLRVISYIFFNMASYRKARKISKRSPPDLIAAYGNMAVPAARLLTRKLGVPLVVRLFGVSLGMKGFSFPMKIAQFEETLSFKLEADRWVITDDGSGGDQAARRLGVPSSKIVHLLCGVERKSAPPDPDRAAYRGKLGLPGDALIILRVARLWRQQRIDRLIKNLPASLPDGRPVAAVIVGDGPERAFLERLSSRCGTRAIFTGALANKELAGHYLCADLYVATSDRTNISNSVLEALCYGLPVVALDTGRTGSLVRDGFNGRLVGIDRTELLPGIISGLLGNEPARRRLSEGALRTAAESIPDFTERMRQEAEAFSL